MSNPEEAVGTLEPEEAEKIQQLNMQSRNLLLHLGQLDVQKQQILKSLEKIQAETLVLNKGIVGRLDLPEGSALSINQKGEIFLVKES